MIIKLDKINLLENLIDLFENYKPIVDMTNGRHVEIPEDIFVDFCRDLGVIFGTLIEKNVNIGDENANEEE